MGDRPQHGRPAGGEGDTLSVLVCRGCCCGTVDKRPGVDHRAQLEQLRAAVGSAPVRRSRLWEVDCLGPCERSNVVVVRAGGRRRWFGEVLREEDTDALAGWLAAGAATTPPERLAGREFHPDDAVPPLESLPWAPAELIDVVVVSLGPSGVGTGGAWVFGVEGGLAEFATDGDEVEVVRRGPVVEATTARGAARIGVTGGVRAFGAPAAGDRSPLVLAVVRSGLAPAAEVVTEVGPDREAVRPSDRAHVLFDLGLGHPSASFCVRAGEEELAARLRSVVGVRWPEALAAVGADLVAASPDRVVRTAAGRVEVHAPIPGPGGASPEGPHTHLLPATLELGRELPVGLRLPAGFAPAGTFYPPAGWSTGVDPTAA